MLKFLNDFLGVIQAKQPAASVTPPFKEGYVPVVKKEVPVETTAPPPAPPTDTTPASKPAPVEAAKAAAVEPPRTPDPATVKKIAKAHPAIREELTNIYYEILQALSGRARCRFAYVYRTFEEQAALYAQGRQPVLAVNALRAKAGLPELSVRDNQDVVTKAPAGLSIHNYAIAVDIVLLVDKDGNGSFESASWDTATDFDKDGVSDWMEVVAIFKAHGWAWGGDWNFKDLPHFEKTFGKKPSDLLALKKAGKVDANGYVIIT